MSDKQNLNQGNARNISGGASTAPSTGAQAPKLGAKPEAKSGKIDVSAIAAGAGGNPIGTQPPVKAPFSVTPGSTTPGNTQKALHPATLGKVAGGFTANEQKVETKATPLSAKVSADALKPTK